MAKTPETWCTTLCHTLDTLRESSTFSDVIIRADNGYIFRAHTCILAASSSVLKTQLLRSQHYLDIPNISRRMWEVLLQFIYTGTVETWDVAEIPGIMQAGKQLQLTQLLSVCEDRMKGSAQQDKCASKEVLFQGRRTCDITQEETSTGTPANNNPEVVNLKTEKLDMVTCKSNLQVEISNTSTDGQDAESGATCAETFNCCTPLNEETEPNNQKDCGNDAWQDTSDCVNKDNMEADVQQNNVISCNLCDKTFHKPASLRQHMYQHTGEKPHICHECGSCFSQHSSLNRHKQLHTGVKPYSCSMCSKAFFRVSHLVTHERQVHSVEKPYKCSDCDEAFSTRSELVVHGRTHVEDKLSSFKCKECEKIFTTLAHLVRHELVHSGDRPFTCDECAKTFRHRSNLWRHKCTDHKHTPTGGMPFECSICGKNFRLKSSLARHEEIHSDVKRHLCVVCGKRFTKQLNLAAHSRTHLDKRPYKCSLCDKAFKDGSNLRRHKLTHSDEKPFLCSACGKGFYRKVDMMEHYHRKHSAEKPYKCVVCGSGFLSRRDLNRHACYKQDFNMVEHVQTGCGISSEVVGAGTVEQEHVEQSTEPSSQSLNFDGVEMLDLVDVETVKIDVGCDSGTQYAEQTSEQSSQPMNVNTIQILRFVI
ncbi:hypothetical protein LSAT2_004019 [Lamellibrachia satsuma]|nr:hypothetical protein LSAT2_004019 [Lamellibrachia satsuma]